MAQEDRGGARRHAASIFGGYRHESSKRRSWDISNPGNQAIRAELARYLRKALERVPTDGALLDAGCGTGWWLRHLWASGVPPERLHGVDILPERVKAARAAVPGAQIAEGDVTALDYADSCFTVVFLVTVLSSLPGRDAVASAIREGWRVLLPGGLLVVWEARVPNPLNPATRLIHRREIESATGVESEGPSLTMFPPLARRMGDRVDPWYPRLARIPALRTHRMYICRRPDRGS
jgi:SAM-dependent methyltransferase